MIIIHKKQTLRDFNNYWFAFFISIINLGLYRQKTKRGAVQYQKTASATKNGTSNPTNNIEGVGAWIL